MVLRPDGNPIAVDDIKIGDLLLSDGGRAVKVVEVSKSTDELFEIKQKTNHQLGKNLKNSFISLVQENRGWFCVRGKELNSMLSRKTEGLAKLVSVEVL